MRVCDGGRGGGGGQIHMCGGVCMLKQDFCLDIDIDIDKNEMDCVPSSCTVGARVVETCRED